MAKVRIDNVDRTIDGEYEFDFVRRRTARELWIYKQVAKSGFGEIGDMIREGSSPLVTAGITTLALVRAGKIGKEQAIHFGNQLLDLGEDETDGTIVLDFTDDDSPADEKGDGGGSPPDGARPENGDEPPAEPSESETTS